MALPVGGLVQDQNNIHSNDASVGWKTNVSKAPRKGAVGGRTPLGDLSNSLKPSVNRAPKKQDPNNFSFIENETGAAVDASKKKPAAKSSVKPQAGVRKALSDISNSGKPRLNETSKNFNAKLSVVDEEPININAIVEERFLHNHQECIKAKPGAMNMNQFLRAIGLDHDLQKELKIPRANPGSSKSQSSPWLLDLEEMNEQLFDNNHCGNYKLSGSRLDSPSPCSTPISPKCCLQPEDLDYVHFKLMESP